MWSLRYMCIWIIMYIRITESVYRKTNCFLAMWIRRPVSWKCARNPETIVLAQFSKQSNELDGVQQHPIAFRTRSHNCNAMPLGQGSLVLRESYDDPATKTGASSCHSRPGSESFPPRLGTRCLTTSLWYQPNYCVEDSRSYLSTSIQYVDSPILMLCLPYN